MSKRLRAWLFFGWMIPIVAYVIYIVIFWRVVN